MANFPSYERTTQLQPAGAIDVQSTYQQFSKQISDFVDKVDEGIVGVNKDRFAAMGAKEGQILGAPRPSRGITALGAIEQKAYDTAQKAVIQNDIAENAQRILHDKLKPGKSIDNNTLEEYNASYEGYSKGLLEKTPVELQPNALAYLAYFKQHGEDHIRSQIDIADRNNLNSVFLKNLDTNQLIAQQSFKAAYSTSDPVKQKIQENAALTAIGQSNRAIEASLAANLITGSQAESLRKRIQLESEESRYLGGYENAVQKGEQTKYLQDFIKKNQRLPDDVKDKIIAKMVTRGKELEFASGMNFAQAKERSDEVITNIENGSTREAQQATINGLSSYSDRLPDFEQRISNAEVFRDTFTTIKALPMAEAQAVIDTNLPKSGDKDFAKKQIFWSKIQKAYKTFNEEFNRDPQRVLASNPYIAQVYQARQTAATTPDGKQQPNSGGSIDVLKSSYNAQIAKGISADKVQIMSVDQASIVAQQLNDPNIPWHERLNQLLKIYNDYEKAGNYGNIAMRDLKRQHVSEQLMIAARSTSTHETSALTQSVLDWAAQKPEDIQAAFKRTPYNENILEANITSHLSDFGDALTNVHGKTVNSYNEVFSNAKSYAQYLLTLGQPKCSSTDDAAELATQVIVNGYYKYPSVNGRTVTIGSDYDERDFKDASHVTIKNMLETKSADIIIPTTYTIDLEANGYSPAQIRKQYIADKVKNSYTIPDSAQQIAMVYDADGNLIKTKDGKTFSFKMSDLKSPGSNLMMDVYNYKGVTRKELSHLAKSIEKNFFAKEARAATFETGIKKQFEQATETAQNKELTK